MVVDHTQVEAFVAHCNSVTPPAHYKVIMTYPEGEGIAIQCTKTGVRVIASWNIYAGQKWMHVSLSRGDRLPSYEDVCRVKEEIIGPERKAIQVHPPKSEHVNIHPYCLHLWSPIGHDPLPDFRINGTI